jgi:hypothetical protein
MVTGCLPSTRPITSADSVQVPWHAPTSASSWTFAGNAIIASSPSPVAGDQAFVAMWLHPGMKPAYEDGIHEALVETGYRPYRVDFAHHTRRIDDEIISQIRHSRLMVADATGARASVYYEAGFAEALGLPVIWCCNNRLRAQIIKPEELAPSMGATATCVETGWFNCVAFDANHLSFILWDDEADLKKKLTDRIRGLGLELLRSQ